MRPALHEITVEVHCEPPRAVKILWAQDYRKNENHINDINSLMKPLPRSRFAMTERVHFVLVNSRHSVRYLMLDYENQVSFNSSSVLTNVDVSRADMAEVYLLQRSDQPVLNN